MEMTRSLLPAVWDVPPVFRKRLGAKVGRQRLMHHDGHLLLVLHAPPHPDDDQRAARFFWRQPDGTWLSSEQGSGRAALERHLDSYDELNHKYDRQEEAAKTAEQYFAVLEALAPLQRATRNLHGVLQDARKALPDVSELIDFRDRAYDLERTVELLYSGTKNGLEFAVAKRAEEQAASARQMAVTSHRLNVLAAFFFPMATLSAVFGVNLVHGLEHVAGPWPFLGLVATGLFSGLVLTAFMTRADGKSR